MQRSKAQRKRDKKIMHELAQEAQVATEIASVGETKRQQEEKALNALLYANGLRVVDIPVRNRFFVCQLRAYGTAKEPPAILSKLHQNLCQHCMRIHCKFMLCGRGGFIHSSNWCLSGFFCE